MHCIGAVLYPKTESTPYIKDYTTNSFVCKGLFEYFLSFFFAFLLALGEKAGEADGDEEKSKQF